MTQPDGEGNGPANTGQPGGVQATLFTQDQVNHFNAQAKRGAVGEFLKELGLDANAAPDTIKEALSKASEYDKLQDGQKNEVQRLTDQLSTANEKANKIPELERRAKVAEIAADAGLKSRYWKYVEGSTEDEIEASVKEVLADVRGDGDGGDEGQQQQQGTGARPPEPNAQQGTGGGKPPAKTMQAGAEAYAAKHKKRE